MKKILQKILTVETLQLMERDLLQEKMYTKTQAQDNKIAAEVSEIQELIRLKKNGITIN